MTSPSPILQVLPLGMPWATQDPFLFCMHHDDPYPRGNGRLGPAASLRGHPLGQDFGNADGWRMYHGREVPGFPAHPHRGFETVTLVRRGRIDHADSLGAAARFGDGDVQWLTAGRGIVHAEMFPLLHTEQPNPLELFQIWLNLPARSKFAAPHFTMLWADAIPHHVLQGPNGAITEVRCIAGALDGSAAPPAPPPDSWAADPRSDLAIWTIRLDLGAAWSLPPAQGPDTRRTLYCFAGGSLQVAGARFDAGVGLVLRADAAVPLANEGTVPVECLLLQGRPIGEPVAQQGPFVMNTERELHEAFADYRRTGFGEWPWPDDAPVHGADAARFARHPDGRIEQPGNT